MTNARNIPIDLHRVRTGHGKPRKSWNLIIGHGKSWKIIGCVVRKLLQVSKQGQNIILARKYPKTMILTIFEDGHKTLGHGKSWNLKNSKKCKPCLQAANRPRHFSGKLRSLRNDHSGDARNQ